GADARISYARWYSNCEGNDPNNDVFTVDISNDDGATWTEVEHVGPSGDEVCGGWFTHSFRVSDLVSPTDKVKLRFTASDLNDGSVVEAAVDAVSIVEVDCDSPVVPGDLN